MRLVQVLATIVLAFVIMTSSPSTGAAEGRKLTGVEIKALYTGATQYAVSRGGKDILGKYFADGTFTLEIHELNWAESGKWWVDGDRLCFVRDTEEGCRTLFHQGGNVYVSEDERGFGHKFRIEK